MELKITHIEKENKIFVGFGKTKLEVSKDSTKWNNEGINEFLISLASQTPDDEDITVSPDEVKDNSVYEHVVNLFTKFAESYSNSKKQL